MSRSRARQNPGEPSQRVLRVGEALRHALAEVLTRGELREPALSGVSITVTEVRATPDLRNAIAFVLPLAGRDADDVLKGLNRSAPYLRAQVARLVRLKFAPELHFRLDERFERADRITELLAQDRARQGARYSDPDDDGA